jgi:hypothetical protein
LAAHTTGNQWPIGLSIFMGSEFKLFVPSPEEDDTDRRRNRTFSGVLSPDSQGYGYGMSEDPDSDILPAVQRVRAVDAGSRNVAPPVRSRELSGQSMQCLHDTVNMLDLSSYSCLAVFIISLHCD